MDPLFATDLVLGAAALAGGIWFRRRAERRPPLALDDRVVVLDMASALRTWGFAAVLLGLLASSGLRGGFDLPVWSVLGLGIGATAAAVAVIRWRREGWGPGDADPNPDRAMVKSETWQYGLLAAAATAFVAYVVGLAIGSMQPVHAVVAVLEGTAGYALGLTIATPQTKVQARSEGPSAAVRARPGAPRRMARSSRAGDRRRKG